MHTQEYLHKRVLAQYEPFLLAWLTGESFFPRSFSVGKVDIEDYAALDAGRMLLHQNAKTTRGYGYIIESDLRRTRKLGLQEIPHHIVFETSDDYLRYLGSGKLREFNHFVVDVEMIRTHLPDLEDWLKANVREIIKYQGQWESLLNVCHYFMENPQPKKYLRELPIQVHTKFIETHQPILDKLLQQLLPTSAYRPQADGFNAKYGLLTKSPLIRIRLLDDNLKKKASLPFDDFAIPLHTLVNRPLPIQKCLIVENEMNFLTVPPISNGICIWGEGFKANLLSQIAWLTEIDLIYWGDIDAQGFQILSNLRSDFHHVRSILMDQETFTKFERYIVSGKESTVTSVHNLTVEERVLYQRVLHENLRLEQERIAQVFVNQVLSDQI